MHSLWQYYFQVGGYADGDAMFGTLAALRQESPSAERDRLLGDALNYQAHLALMIFERARADQLLAEAQPLVEGSGDVRLQAFYQLVLAYALPWEQPIRPSHAAQKALALYQSIGDSWGEASGYVSLANNRWFSDQKPDQALIEVVERALALTAAMGDTFTYMRALIMSAFVIHSAPENSLNRLALLEQVLDLRRCGKNPTMLANALNNVALEKIKVGRLTEAARDLEEVLAVRRQQGNLRDTVGFDDLGETYLRLGRLAEARPLFEEGLSRVRDTEHQAWQNVYRLYLAHVAFVEGDYSEVKAIAEAVADEKIDADTPGRQFRRTHVFALAGLSALEGGDSTGARGWCERAAQSAEADPNPNGALFTRMVLGLIALAEGNFEEALSLLESAYDYCRDEYHPDNSIGWERDLAMMLALCGSSRAAVRIDRLGRALDYNRQALTLATQKQVDAFALMAFIPAAELALANGDPEQAALLAGLVAEHPHTFAADHAEALGLLATLPEEPTTAEEPPDLWMTVEELGEA